MRRAFSLVELLSVVAILAVVAAIVFPAVASARRSADQSSCANNLHQLWVAASLYRSDYGGEGRYGNVYVMGLPPFPQYDTLPVIRRFHCVAVPNDVIFSKNAVPYVTPMAPPELDNVRPSWADYAVRFEERAMLWFDVNHNPAGVPLLAPQTTKRAFGVDLGGALQSHRSNGDPLDRLWWHERSGMEDER